MSVGIRDRFQGTLAGLAVGAAYGAALQGREAPGRKKKAPGLPELPAGEGVLPGPVPEETRLVLSFLESLAEHGRVDLPDLARRHVAFLESGPRRVSALTGAAIAELAKGASAADSGRLALDQGEAAGGGNGSVLSAIPVGLLHVGELRGVADDAAAASRITHVDPRCVAACRALTMGLALVVRGQDDEVLERASLVSSPSPAIRAAVERAPTADPRKLTLDGADRDLCVRALEASFAAYCWAPSFEQGLRAVVEGGGDSAVNGALTGALLGARFGPKGIPETWAAKSAGREELVAAGDRLWKRIFPGSGAAAAD